MVASLFGLVAQLLGDIECNRLFETFWPISRCFKRCGTEPWQTVGPVLERKASYYLRSCRQIRLVSEQYELQARPQQASREVQGKGIRRRCATTTRPRRKSALASHLISLSVSEDVDRHIYAAECVGHALLFASFHSEGELKFEHEFVRALR